MGLGLGIGLSLGDFRGVIGGAGGSAPSFTVAPSISGTPTQGQTLTVSNGTVINSPSRFEYQWYSAGVAIAGASAKTYVLQASDVGNLITAKVYAFNPAGSASATSAAVGPVTAAGSYTPALKFNDRRNSMYL